MLKMMKQREKGAGKSHSSAKSSALSVTVSAATAADLIGSVLSGKTLVIPTNAQELTTTKPSPGAAGAEESIVETVEEHRLGLHVLLESLYSAQTAPRLTAADSTVVVALNEQLCPLRRILEDQMFAYSLERGTQARSRLWALRTAAEILSLRSTVLHTASNHSPSPTVASLRESLDFLHQQQQHHNHTSSSSFVHSRRSVHSRRQAAALRAPAFVLYALCVRLGASNVAAQRCWEFYQTLLRYRAVDRTCELLCMLFDEAYDTADFDFVVQCRDLVMSVTDSDATDLTSLMLPTERWLFLANAVFDMHAALQFVELLRTHSTAGDRGSSASVPAITFIVLALSLRRTAAGKAPIVPYGLSTDEHFVWRCMPEATKAAAVWDYLVDEAIRDVADDAARDLRYASKIEELVESALQRQTEKAALLANQVEDLQAQLARTDDALFKAESRSLAEKERNTELVHCKQHLETSLAEAQQQLSHLQEQITALRADLSTQQETVAERDRMLEACAVERKQKSAEIAWLKSSLSDAKSQLESSAQLRVAADTARQSALAEQQSLREQLTQSQQEAATAQATNAVLVAENTALQDQLQTAQSEIALLKDEVAKLQLEITASRAAGEQAQREAVARSATDAQTAQADAVRERAQREKVEVELAQRIGELAAVRREAAQRQDTLAEQVRVQSARIQELERSLQAVSSTESAELELDYHREMQEQLSALQAKCEAAEAQCEWKLSEKDAAIEAVQSELVVMQEAADSRISELTVELESVRDHCAQQAAAATAEIESLRAALEQQRQLIAQATAAAQSAEAELATLRAAHSDLTAEREQAQHVLQVEASRRRIHGQVRTSPVQAAATPELSPPLTPSSPMTPTSRMSIIEEPDERTVLENCRVGDISEMMALEVGPPDADAGDLSLFFSLHGSATSKSAYKSEIVKKTRNPKWAPMLEWRDAAAKALPTCIVRVWAHRRLLRDVLVLEKQIDVRTLVRWNPFAGDAPTNAVLFVIKGHTYTTASPASPPQATPPLQPVTRSTSLSLIAQGAVAVAVPATDAAAADGTRSPPQLVTSQTVPILLPSQSVAAEEEKSAAAAVPVSAVTVQPSVDSVVPASVTQPAAVPLTVAQQSSSPAAAASDASSQAPTAALAAPTPVLVDPVSPVAPATAVAAVLPVSKSDASDQPDAVLEVAAVASPPSRATSAQDEPVAPVAAAAAAATPAVVSPVSPAAPVREPQSESSAVRAAETAPAPVVVVAAVASPAASAAAPAASTEAAPAAAPPATATLAPVVAVSPAGSAAPAAPAASAAPSATVAPATKEADAFIAVRDVRAATVDETALRRVSTNPLFRRRA